jgi:hypothetical protein
LVRVLARRLAVGVLVADEAGVGLALVVRFFAVVEHLDVLVSEIDFGGLFFAGGEAERAEQKGEEPVHGCMIEDVARICNWRRERSSEILCF